MSLACSVIIPTYNAVGTLGDQLDALSRQEGGLAFEVIVADNGSTDDLAALIVQRSASLNLRMVDAADRQGPSAARNIGASFATAPLLLFCDADDRVGPSWVPALVGALREHSFAGGPYRPFATRPGGWMPHYDEDRLPKVSWDSWSYAFGGNIGVRTELWHVLGGFDESLTGAEEIEFAWRARQLGHEPVFVPEAWLDYRIRAGLRGRLWHEYNSGRGTATLARRIAPDHAVRRPWKSELKHVAMLAARFPKNGRRADWEAWCAVLAYHAGTRAAGETSMHR